MLEGHELEMRFLFKRQRLRKVSVLVFASMSFIIAAVCFWSFDHASVFCCVMSLLTAWEAKREAMTKYADWMPQRDAGE